MNGRSIFIVAICFIAACFFFSGAFRNLVMGRAFGSDPQDVSDAGKKCAAACGRNYQLMQEFTIYGECKCRQK
jgi:hypothetical protein